MTACPLPQGHYYGPNTGDLKSHDGSDHPADEFNIRLWQRAYALAYDRDQPITGRFDGPTQRAAVKIQRSLGLDVTAMLDAPTWEALFKPSETAVEAPTAPAVVDDTPAAPVEAPARGRAKLRHRG
jgi:peptidoglycan hydrolase-like protein with peptidoglycan-binding domain